MRSNRFTLLILLLYSWTTLFGQNITDPLGLKQGYWKYEKTDTVSYVEVTVGEGSRPVTKYVSHVEFEGEYKNGKRTGKWISRVGKDQILSEFTFIEGKPVGSFVVYSDSQRNLVKYEGIIEAGKRTAYIESRSYVGMSLGKVAVDVNEFVSRWSYTEEYE